MSEDRERSRDRSRRDRASRFSERSRERSPDRGRGAGKGGGNRVFVSNIPYEYRWQDLKDLFRDKVGEVQYVELFLDDNDKSKGCGVVDFADPESVKKCLDVMQRYEVKGRQLIVKEDTGNPRDKYGKPSGKKRDEGKMRDGFSYQGSSASLDKWGNTYGLSPSFLESLHIDMPLCNRVFVANLEYNVDKKKLKEIFRLAGKVQRVDLHTDKDGRSRGFAVVEYDHPVEAVQAISMFHNQVLYDRAMTVRMDRANDSAQLPKGLKGVGMGLGPSGEPLRDVARNLPSLNTSATGQSVNPAPMVSNVPSQALQMASALSNLNSVGGAAALGNLAATQIQANLSNLLGGGLAALASGNPVSNSSSTGNLGSFGRDSQPNTFNTSQNYPSQRPFTTEKTSTFSYGGDRDGFAARNQTGGIAQNNSRFSSKVLITNLPSTASYKMLLEKFGEFGDVQHLEERGNGGMLIVYGSEWQAERAIKNLDRARIDGRTIEARPYY